MLSRELPSCLPGRLQPFADDAERALDEAGSAPEVAAPGDTDAGEGEGVAADDMDVPLEEPASYRPLVAAAVLRPANVEATGLLTLIIRAKTAPGWHIYAANQPAGTSQPTRLDFDLPTASSRRAIEYIRGHGPRGERRAVHLRGRIIVQRRRRPAREALPGPPKSIARSTIKLVIRSPVGHQIPSSWKRRPT